MFNFSAISSCPPGARKIVDGNVTSCYSFHVSPASWYDAVKTCKSESIDSHLVSIDSQKEQQTLVDIIHNDAGIYRVSIDSQNKSVKIGR